MLDKPINEILDIKRLDNFINSLIKNKFSGRVEIQINMFKGGVASVQLREVRTSKYKNLSLLDK